MLETNVVNGVLCVEAHQIRVGASERGDGFDIPERHAVNMPALGFFGPIRFADPDRHQSPRLLDSDAVKDDVLNRGGIAVVNPKQPFPSFVVNDVAIGKEHIGERFPQFGPEAQRMRKFVPENALLYRHVPQFSLVLVRFQNDQIVECPQKAVGDLHLPAVANIHSVRVAPPPEDFHVFDFHPVGPAHRQGKAARIPQNHPLNADVGAGHPQDRPGVPRAKAAVDDAPSAQRDIGACGFAPVAAPYTTAPGAT